MHIGKVIGTVVSTNRNPQLTGLKLLVVQKLTEKLEPMQETEVVVDAIGAGVGETVIIATGGSARVPFEAENRTAPVDATIIEIVDILEVNDG